MKNPSDCSMSSVVIRGEAVRVVVISNALSSCCCDDDLVSVVVVENL